MGSSWHHVVVDSSDPARLARWWAQVLGYTVVYEDPEETDIAPAPGEFPQLVFVPVPQLKRTKNRLHLDLNPEDQTAEVERLVDMGARRVDIDQPDTAPWVVLADPEGNEFCVLTGR